MGSGFKTFTAGAVLTASDVNNYLMEQSIMVFATTAARDLAITSPEEGMVAFIGSNDANEGLYVYHGATGGWRKGPGWNAPWGVVSSNSNIATSSATSGTTELVVSTGTAFTAVANRNYQIIYSTTAFNAASGDAIFEVRLRKDDAAGTQLHLGKFVTGVPYYRNLITVSTVFTASAGSFTPVATFKRDFGSGTAQTIDITSMTVTDIGPSGAPA
jgi:hypothetical protein